MTSNSCRWLVVGSTGMLGSDVLATLNGREVTGLSRRELDISDANATLAAVADYDVVVNCAAWTNVDDAEAHEDSAFAANAIGAANLARACASSGGRLVHVSTDYVFAGDATSPYPENAPIAPRSAYGRTKAAGEWAVRAELPDRSWIIRTAWLYGENGPSFVRTIAALESQRDTIEVVDDQFGQPTWSRDLARRIVDTVDADAPAGIYHGTASGETNWFGLARRVFELLGADPDRVRPTNSAAFVRPALRPAYSVLGHQGWSRAGLPPMRAWETALDAAWPI